jgi:hypothetical protein
MASTSRQNFTFAWNTWASENILQDLCLPSVQSLANFSKEFHKEDTSSNFKPSNYMQQIKVTRVSVHDIKKWALWWSPQSLSSGQREMEQLQCMFWGIQSVQSKCIKTENLNKEGGGRLQPHSLLLQALPDTGCYDPENQRASLAIRSEAPKPACV